MTTTIIKFPLRKETKGRRYRSIETLGEDAFMSVEIVAAYEAPHELMVVLHPTIDGFTDVCTLLGDQIETARIVAKAVFEAIDVTQDTMVHERRTSAE